MTTIINRQRKEAIAQPLTIILLSCFAFTFAVPLSSSLYTEYVYNYDVRIASGDSGLWMKAKANLEILYGTSASADNENSLVESDEAGSNSFLVSLKLTEPVFYSGNERDNQQQPLVMDAKYDNLYNQNHELYAHIVVLSNGTALVREVFTHRADATTFKNLKKSILLNLIPTNHHLQQLSATGAPQAPTHPTCNHDNSDDQPELFSPDSISGVRITAKAKYNHGSKLSSQASNNQIDTSTAANLLLGPTIFESVDGYQNVTLRSRVFAQAESILTTEFHLKLVNELKPSAHSKHSLDKAGSVRGAMKSLNLDKYQADTTQLERERRVCSNLHCGRTLDKIFLSYKDSMADESMASIEATVAYLRLLDRLRDSSGTGVQEIQALLKRVKGHHGIENSILDILAAARTKNSISVAFKHVRLAKSKNLDMAERFLSALSVAAKTAAKMRLRRPLWSPYYYKQDKPLKRSQSASEQHSKMASLDYIALELLKIIEQTPAKKWSSQKLRWSSLLTLATLVNAYNQEHDIADPSQDELDQKVLKLVTTELKTCAKYDTDCRIVSLQAIGNIAHLSETEYSILKQEILTGSKRESVAATRVLRDLLQNHPKDRPLDAKFYSDLKDLLLRIVYGSAHETTARVLAAEMVVRFLPNPLISEEILRHLPAFGNTELATMIYSRMSSLKPDTLAKHHRDWYWQSCIVNGTSTSFVRTLAKTESMNASYGVSVENSNKGKILKESAFDVFLDTKRQTQDLLSLGIFTRGVSGLTGGSDDDESEDEHDKESAMAGMILRILGGYLRPIVFFKSMGELMGHVWAGTASDLTTAFSGDLMLIDHEEGYPLISGFVVEQQMRGVLSIDVSGQVSVSIWHRSSDSLVTTKAAIGVQASQSVFTSFDNMYDSHLFSFGGQAQIDFIANVIFAHSPLQTCLQVTQPEFKVRYHSRRHDQMMTDKVRRRLVRRMYTIGGKSYPLNSENNKMCAMMISDEL